MKLLDAKEKINAISYKKLGEFLTPNQLEGIIKNKGKSGQLLETTIGLNLSNTNLDFEDGELKTNKCDKTGKPLETMFITQIAGIIDDLLISKNFYESKLYCKMKNLLYVPISKDGNPEEWFFFPTTHVDLNEDKFFELKLQLEKDYYSICEQLKKHIETGNDGFIHTSNGKFIQIRSKDSKPYHPIHSKFYGKNISDKNHAFYFKKDFINYIKNI